MKMRNLVELIFSSTRKTSFYGGLLRAWGVYSVFILEDVASDKRLDVLLLFPLWCLLIVCRKGLTVALKKSPGLGLLGKSGAGKTTTLLLSWLTWQVAPCGLVDGKNELQALSTPINVPLSPGRPFYAGYVSLKWSNEAKKEHVRDA